MGFPHGPGGAPACLDSKARTTQRAPSRSSTQWKVVSKDIASVAVQTSFLHAFALPQTGKLAFDFSEGLVVGLGLPDGAEREQLRAKWAEFSDNIASYVVRSSAFVGEMKLCKVTVQVQTLHERPWSCQTSLGFVCAWMAVLMFSAAAICCPGVPVCSFSWPRITTINAPSVSTNSSPCCLHACPSGTRSTCSCSCLKG